LSKGIHIHEDAPPSPNQYALDLETENEALRRKLESLERELRSQSPTRSAKKAPLSTRAGQEEFGPILSKLDGLQVDENDERAINAKTPSKAEAKTPGRKARKLTAKKWDLMDENEMDGYGQYY